MPIPLSEGPHSVEPSASRIPARMSARHSRGKLGASPSSIRKHPVAAMSDVLSLIGNTPLVRITRIDTGPCELFLKLENQNPGGSIKDRVALSMIEAAEREGRIRPGDTLIEATAGNTGLGLGLVAA